MRWWGWIETLHLRRPEEQLLLASLLDLPELSAFGRVWAERIGRPVDRLVPVGDAPSWTGRAEGLKRWLGGPAVNADPWRLFPAWVRDQLPVPPGDATPKMRRLGFLAVASARCPTWVAVRGGDARAVWSELREMEMKPWIHRRLPEAAKLPPETDLSRVAAFKSGKLIVEDLASQAVGLACDPDPGERWWDVRGEADGGLVALPPRRAHGRERLDRLHVRHGASPSRGRTAAAARGAPQHHHEGARRAAPCRQGRQLRRRDRRCASSGVGSWRRHPDARWAVTAEQVPKLAAEAVRMLDVASTRVKPGGTLVYTVSTFTRAETTGVVEEFLRSHPGFQLQPFPHPLEDTTTGGTVTIWPHLHDCDGRFIARMIRSGSPRGIQGKTGGADAGDGGT